MKKLLFIFFLPIFVMAGNQSPRFFTGDGKHFAKVAGKTQEPKMVVHELNIVAGTGTLALNKVFSRQKNRVSGTADTNMVVTVTGILNTPSSTVRYYSVYKSKNGDSLIVKSSGGSADTSRVNLQIVLK